METSGGICKCNSMVPKRRLLSSKGLLQIPLQKPDIIDDRTEGIMPCPTISGSANQPTLSTYSTGNPVKVEWNGSWWDALIRDVNADKYLIHYVGFDASWDEWVGSVESKQFDFTQKIPIFIA